jgi:outer membrane biosynthesis protein TonB
MRAPFAALNKCTQDLVAHWGLDVEEQRNRASGPVWTNLPRIASRIQDDYPSSALRKGEQATIAFRIMIDDTGKPTNCVRTDITKAENFDDGTCRLVMRMGRFEPARATDGSPLPSYNVTQVRYVIR